MTRSVPAPRSLPKPKSKSLVQQNIDFTSEGAPPPGHVAGVVSIAPPALRHAASRTPANIPGAHRRAPVGKRR
jgi:hypothetical protein